MDWALNNLQRLICPKTQTTNQPNIHIDMHIKTNSYLYICSKICTYTHIYVYIVIQIHVYVHISSSCRAGSTDISDPLSPLFPIVHRLRKVFWTTSHSCWMYVRASRPAFARPCVGSTRVHRLWVRPCFSSSVLHIYIYIYIYIYILSKTDSFVLSELFNVARHAGRSKLGSKTVQLYVRLSLRPLGHQADHVGYGNFKVFI